MLNAVTRAIQRKSLPCVKGGGFATGEDGGIAYVLKVILI